MIMVIKLTDQAEISASKINSTGTTIHSNQFNQSGKSGVAAAIMLRPNKYSVAKVSVNPIPAGSQK
jgi:hypothetical protein